MKDPFLNNETIRLVPLINFSEYSLYVHTNINDYHRGHTLGIFNRCIIFKSIEMLSAPQSLRH